jgi:hypothetical protein
VALATQPKEFGYAVSYVMDKLARHVREQAVSAG